MGNVRLYGSTSGYTELAPPAVAPDGVLSLPSGTGTLATQAYVDTAETDAINTAIAGGGLVHIATESFSAVSSVSLNDVFTSAYENYRILIRVINSGGSVGILFRMRASGSDASGSNYNRQLIDVSGSSFVGASAASQSSGVFSITSTTDSATASGDLYGPQLSVRTVAVTLGNYDDKIRQQNTTHTLTTSYDGITFFPESGTITGTIRVYGYQNS
jgi:hypothetical protein